MQGVEGLAILVAVSRAGLFVINAMVFGHEMALLSMHEEASVQTLRFGICRILEMRRGRRIIPE